MPYIGKKPADIIATVIDTTTGTFSGEVDAGSLDVSGNADIDGTTNLDNTDIDGTLDVSGNLTVDTNTLFVDSANNRVGVGTASPNANTKLDVNGAARIGNSTDGIMIENNTGSFDIDNASYIRRDSSSGALEITSGSTTARNMIFNTKTSGAESARIDSSGNLLVGGTTTNHQTGSSQEQLSYIAGGYFAVSRSGNDVAFFNRQSSDGSIINIRKDGTTVGSIGSVSGVSLAIDGKANFVGVRMGSDNLTPRYNGADADNAVDIGNSTYKFKDLYLSGNAGVGANPSSFNGGANNLVVGTGSGSEGISIFADSSSNSSIFFADGDSTTTGQLNYQHASNAFTFHTNGGTERMRIDSSGNLLVGKTANDIATVGHKLGGGGSYASFSRASNPPLYVNRNSADGAVIGIQKDGADVGSIGANGSNPFLANSSSRGISLGSNVVPCDSSGTKADNVSDLGIATGRFKDLYLSGGAYLGGTGSANYLDDYEEGTWTPALTGLTLTLAQGRYTKIGQIVHWGFRVVLPATTANTHFNVTGLPFTHSLSGDYIFGGALIYANGNIGADVTCIVVNNGVQFYKNGSTFVEFVDYTGKDVRASGAYITTD
jgi:hypothetical protein